METDDRQWARCRGEEANMAQETREAALERTLRRIDDISRQIKETPDTWRKAALGDSLRATVKELARIARKSGNGSDSQL